jgi:hypothetical protein
MTARKGKPEQNSLNGRQAKRNRKMMACRSKMPGQTARTGLPVHGCQYRTARTGLQCRSAKTGLPEHDFRDRRARAFCSDIALILAFILALSLNLKGLCGTNFFV